MGWLRKAWGSVLVLGLAGCGQAAQVAAPVSISPGPPSASSVPPSLEAILANLPLPPGSRPTVSADVPELRGGGSPLGETYAPAGARKTEQQFWTNPANLSTVRAWFGSHPESGSTGSGGSWGSVGGGFAHTDPYQKPQPIPEIDVFQFNWGATKTQIGPDLVVSLAADPQGGTEISGYAVIEAIPARLPGDTVDGVTQVVLSQRATMQVDVQPAEGFPVVTLIGPPATKLATDLNAVGAAPYGTHGCLAGLTEVHLSFATASGEKQFVWDRNCDAFSMIPDGQALGMSTALDADITAALHLK
jgi:hypothetical protein